MKGTTRRSPTASVGLVGEIINNVRLAWKLLGDSRVGLSTKLLIPGLAIGYLLFPADLLPDFVPVLGQLDDLALIALGVRLFINMVPQGIVQEYRARMDGNRDVKRTTDEGSVVDGEFRVIE